MPAEDSLTSRYVEHFELWHLRRYGIKIISIEPFCCHLGIPIFKGTVYGEFFERETGLKRGITADMYVVGKMDVQHVIHDHWTHDENGLPKIIRGFEQEGEVVEDGSRRIRTTLRKAKYTARLVSDCVPIWADFRKRREAKLNSYVDNIPSEAAHEIDDLESQIIRSAIEGR